MPPELALVRISFDPALRDEVDAANQKWNLENPGIATMVWANDGACSVDPGFVNYLRSARPDITFVVLP
jgi:hypothetical protein